MRCTIIASHSFACLEGASIITHDYVAAAIFSVPLFILLYLIYYRLGNMEVKQR